MRVVGLPSSPRPPGKNRRTTSAHQSTLHVPTPPSESRYTVQRHRSTLAIPSESRRSTHAAPHPLLIVRHPPASEMPSPQSDYGKVEHIKTNQPKVNTSPHSSDMAGYYWNHVGDALAQWKVGIPTLSNILDESVEDDSHLFKVMRAYHLNKAQTREELPNWLFDERERGKFALLRGRNPEMFEGSGDMGRPQRNQVVPPKQPLDNPYSGGSPVHGQRWTRVLSKRWKPGTTRSESVRLV